MKLIKIIITGRFVNRNYLFYDGEELICELLRTGLFLHTARVSFGDNLWKFAEKGLWKTRMEVIDLKNNSIIAKSPRAIASFYFQLEINQQMYRLAYLEQFEKYCWIDVSGERLIDYDISDILKNINNNLRKDVTAEARIYTSSNTDSNLLLVYGLFVLINKLNIDNAVWG